MKKIKIIAGNVAVQAELIDCKTTENIWNILPIEGKVNRWGDEIYFSIPLKMDEENGKDIVNIGDIGYWPPGSAFCIFFGKTPASTDKEIKAASNVNIFGRIVGDATVFKEVSSGARITIEKLE